MKESRAQQSTSHWTIGRAPALAHLVLFAGLALSAACGGDSSGPPAPPATPVGNYTASTVNGKAPPAAIIDTANFKIEVTKATISLTSDGKYLGVLTTAWTIPGNVSTYVDSAAGTWVQTGTTINLTNTQDNSTDTATWANGQLTFVETDAATKRTVTYVYSKK